MQQEIGEMLKQSMTRVLNLRGVRIKDRLALIDTALQNDDPQAIYRYLFELSRQAETFCKELREVMITFYSDLQLAGIFHPLLPYPQTDDVMVSVDGNCLKLKFGAILPFSAGGSAYYLHEHVRNALERIIRERKLPRPFFNERCAVVFLHHYAIAKGIVRFLRDYDNVEHRCITNVLASLSMCGDGPQCMIALDILAPDNQDFTEVRIMPISDFKQFVASENLDYISL